MGQKNGLHAFGYNSAENKPIWIKLGTLWAKCWRLALADFGRGHRYGRRCLARLACSVSLTVTRISCGTHKTGRNFIYLSTAGSKAVPVGWSANRETQLHVVLFCDGYVSIVGPWGLRCSVVFYIWICRYHLIEYDIIYAVTAVQRLRQCVHMYSPFERLCSASLGLKKWGVP